MRVIVLGGTGLVGSHMIQIMLEDPRYSEIISFTRRSHGISHPKFSEIICDLFELESQVDQFHGDAVFCCIGTTLKKTPDRDIYQKIDKGIPVAAAKLADKNNIPTFIVVSSMGADAGSSIFYNRTKGEMEETVLETEIPKIHIVRPSLIGGDRQESRFGESFGKFLFGILNPIIPKKYKMVHPKTIAQAMLHLADCNHEEAIVESDQILILGKS